MTTIDWTKPIEWRGSYVAAAHFVAFYGDGVIIDLEGVYTKYTQDGKLRGCGPRQFIFNVAKPKATGTRWIGLYRDSSGYVWCQTSVQKPGGSTRLCGKLIALKEIAITEGEGMDASG